MVKQSGCDTVPTLILRTSCRGVNRGTWRLIEICSTLRRGDVPAGYINKQDSRVIGRGVSIQVQIYVEGIEVLCPFSGDSTDENDH